MYANGRLGEPSLPMIAIGGKRLAVGNTLETAAMVIAALPEAAG